jgi:hypothetical protein
MKSMLIITAAALAAIFVVPAKAAGQPYCFYQDQKFSEGAVLNGRVCTRGNANGKTGEWTWVPQEKVELSGMQQEVERIHMQTQLVQARMILAETEARYREAAAKSSGKN